MPVSRITGMSGFDTEGTVKKLMDAERIPLNKMMGQQQVLQWKQDLYRDINKSFAALNSTVDKMRYVSSWGSYKTSSSNSGAVSVTNASAGGEATHSIKVNQLASAAKKIGGSLSSLPGSDTIAGTVAISTLPDVSSTRSMSVDFGGVKKTIQITSTDLSGATGSTNAEKMQTVLQGKLNLAFGNGAIDVSIDASNHLVLKPGAALATKPEIKVSNYGSDALATELGLNGLASKINLSTTIEDLRNKLGITDTNAIAGTKDISTLPSDYFTSPSTPRSLKVEYNGSVQVVEITDSDISVEGSLEKALQQKMNSAFGVNGEITVSKDGTTNQLRIDTSTGGKVKITANGNDTFAADLGINGQSNFDLVGIQINGASLPRISAGQSVQGFINAINGSDAGVRVSYEATNQSFTFTSKDSGSTAMINFAGSDPKALSFLTKIKVSPGDTARGTDALINLDGVDIVRNSNTFTQDGVTYTLNETTPSSADPIVVNVQRDTAGLYDKIADFVTKYNDMVSLVSGKLTEKTTYRKYAPLTADQKQAMKDTEITAWEEKAKGGLLHNDSMLQSALNDLRSRVTSPVAGIKSGDPNMLSQIGIDTSKNMSESGKLVIDEETLRKAIADNPSGVMALFTAKSSSSDKKSDQYKSESGIATRLFQRIDVFNHGIIDEINKKIENKLNPADSSALEKQIQDFQRRIDDMNTSLSQKEDAYYRKFAAVEKALSNANSQSSWLASQLGGGK